MVVIGFPEYRAIAQRLTRPMNKYTHGFHTSLLSALLFIIVLFHVSNCHAGVSNVISKGKSIAYTVLTNKYVTAFSFRSGMLIYAYYNAQSDAFVWDTLYGDGITYGRATQKRWHLNKNIANTGLMMAGGAMAIDLFVNKQPVRKLFGRTLTTFAASYAMWQRSYRSGRYGDPFPLNPDLYQNAITIPLPGGDYVYALNEKRARTLDMLCWTAFSIGILIDPMWRD